MKPAWATQLTRLPCLVVYAKCQSVGNVHPYVLLHESCHTSPIQVGPWNWWRPRPVSLFVIIGRSSSSLGPLMLISNHSLDLGGTWEDIAYPKALIECLLRSPSQLDVRTVGSQQKLTAHFAFSNKHKLKLDVYHEARQSSQLFSPDRFRCFC